MPPLVAIRYDPVKTRAVHFERRVAELVEGHEANSRRVGGRLSSAPALGLAELRHQRAVLKKRTGIPRRVASMPNAVTTRVLPRHVSP